MASPLESENPLNRFAPIRRGLTMENGSTSDARMALGMASALSMAVLAMALTHPQPDLLKAELSRVFSAMTEPGSPLDRSPELKEGWYSVVRKLQQALGGFPVMSEIDASAESGRQPQ
ncbi:hypothetical protein MyNCGM121_41240 [Achromobacter xylosoxidans]